MIGKIFQHKRHASLTVQVVSLYNDAKGVYDGFVIQIISLGDANIDINDIGVSISYHDYIKTNNITSYNEDLISALAPVLLNKKYFIWENYLITNYSEQHADIYSSLFEVLNVSKD